MSPPPVWIPEPAALVEAPRPPHGFQRTKDGVLYVPVDANKPAVFICGPLDIVAQTSNDHGEEWGRLLEWPDPRGRQHTWAMPAAALVGDGLAMRQYLADRGLQIMPGKQAHELLIMYIQLAEPGAWVRCTSRTGWCDGLFVLPDCIIGKPDTERIFWQGVHAGEHYYGVRGTLEQWKEQIAKKCLGNSRLLFAVSSAFAGALLELLGIENGGFHLFGGSSIGKSVALRVAGSVIGGGGPRGFVDSWRATQNALEWMAEAHNDCALFLDELRELPDAAADAVVYQLASGVGKARMTRSLGAARAHRWRFLFLSNGEIVLAEHAATGGRKLRGGSEVRLVNIPGDAGAGLGLFEKLHGAADGKEFADTLVEATRFHYGEAYRAFLRALVGDLEKYTIEARALLCQFVSDNEPKRAAPEVARALRRFGVVAAAGELAVEMGVLPWPPLAAWWGAQACFQAWLGARGGTDSFDAMAALAQVRAFLEAHGSSRFEGIMFLLSGDAVHEKVINRAGFWRLDADSPGEREFLIFPEIFRREVCVGFAPQAVLAELDRRGCLSLESRSMDTARQNAGG